MKHAAIFTLLLSFMFGYTQTQIEISAPISVTNNVAIYGRHLPKVELLDNGNAIVFWSKSGSPSKLYIAIKEGEIFSDPIQVPTGSVSPNVWGNSLGPDFAVRDSVIFVVFEKYGDAIYSVKSNDRGLSFSDPVVVYDPPAGRYATLPTIIIDNDYNPIVSVINTNSSEGDAQYMVIRSNDNGETYEEAINASTAVNGEEVCECCPSGLLIDNGGDIYLSFRNNDENIRDNWVSKSTDGGQTFPFASDVDETDWFIQGCPSTGPQSFDMGSELVNVFFSNAEEWESGVYMSTLNKETMTTGSTIKLPTIDDSGNIQYFPRIDGNADTIGIVWQESVDSNGEIILSYSINGISDILQNAVNISNMPGTQKFTDIVFKNGKYHIVYEDVTSGTIMYQMVSIQEPVIVDDVSDLSYNFTVFPNPGNSMVTISLDDKTINAAFVISDISGRIFYQNEQFSNKQTIDISEWERGVYLVAIEVNNRKLIKKLIVH